MANTFDKFVKGLSFVAIYFDDLLYFYYTPVFDGTYYGMASGGRAGVWVGGV
jgi:hypothetical protein